MAALQRVGSTELPLTPRGYDTFTEVTDCVGEFHTAKRGVFDRDRLRLREGRNRIFESFFSAAKAAHVLGEKKRAVELREQTGKFLVLARDRFKAR